jgi:hypothetical protein
MFRELRVVLADLVENHSASFAAYEELLTGLLGRSAAADPEHADRHRRRAPQGAGLPQ